MPAGDSLQSYDKLQFNGTTTEFTVVQQRQMQSRRIVGVFVPAGFVGAQITLLGSPNAVEWFDVQSISGQGPYTVPVSPGQYIPLDPRVVAALAYLRLVSDADEGSKEIMVASRAID